MSFRGLVLKQLGSTFTEGINNVSLEAIPRKALSKNAVRISNRASGLNFFDLLMLVGRYQDKPPIPYVVGTEGSGVVTEVGANVRTLKVGDAVMYAQGRAGAMAEESVVDEHLCTLKPASISHAQAAGLLVGFNTAYHGLVQRGDLKAGETLLVTGAAGGMGLAAVELGKLLGATVIAAASSEEKLQLARQAGASETVNYSNLKDFKDQVMTKTGGRGVDVVYEVVGGEVFTQCTRVMAPLGRLLVVGFASGTIPTIPANIPLIKGFSVVGVRAGAEMRRNPAFALEMNKKVQEWGAEGKLSPLVTQVNASGWKQLFTAMADRKVVGKAVVVWEETAKL